MEYGEREIGRECDGPDVTELQIRLAGFRGTLPDGEFGPGTERQVMSFQRDYMKMREPKRGRTSTNHHGKAIDIGMVAKPGEDQQQDTVKCEAARGCLVSTADAQVGWTASNRKAIRV